MSPFIKNTSILIAALMCAMTSLASNDLKVELDSLFAARYGNDTDAPGAAVLIAKGDTVIYERYFGVADMDTKEPISESTRFNIASVSKQFTVAALLQTGIDIDRPVSDFFDFPQDFWQRVTLRHLASHTSGVPDSRDRSDRMRCVYADDALSVSYFPSVQATKFEPGEAYDYLNPSFILLAQVVEQQSGEDFIDYVHNHIFSPSGMDSTYYFDPAISQPNTAHGYVPDDKGAWIEYDYGEETFFATRPDGGIYSTVRDMYRWERALASRTILSQDKMSEAYSHQIKVTGSQWCDYQNRADTWYGLGWFIDTSHHESVKVYHTGDNGGFQAYVAKYPEKDLCIIVLENRNDQDRWDMALQIDHILGIQ